MPSNRHRPDNDDCDPRPRGIGVSGVGSPIDFNLVIDGRDNDRAFDAPASEVTVLAEVVCSSKNDPSPSRGRSPVMCGVMIGIVVVPAPSIDDMGRWASRWPSLVLSLDQHRRDRLMEDGVISPDEIDDRAGMSIGSVHHDRRPRTFTTASERRFSFLNVIDHALVQPVRGCSSVTLLPRAIRENSRWSPSWPVRS